MEALDCVRSRYERHTRSAHLSLRANLVAHALHHLRRRPDEDELRFLARTHEGRVLGKEAVAGVNGIASRRLRGGDDVRDSQIALRGRRWADADRAVRELDVARACVRSGVDRDRLDPELVQRADHPHRDLAPIRYEDAREHAPTSRCLIGD